MERVLLIDDDEGNRMTMAGLLEDDGFEVSEAATPTTPTSTMSSHTAAARSSRVGADSPALPSAGISNVERRAAPVGFRGR